MVSSYTPTVGALIKAQAGYRPLSKVNVKALLVAEPNAPGLSPLSNTVQEIMTVGSTLPKESILMLPGLDKLKPELGATSGAVLAQLPRADILHLACHGQQDLENPLRSGFCLRDKRLTIEDLMSCNLPNAFFAFLSACETAKGDESQPDQTIHLAASMLFVGFRSLICTMW
jgi:CHAT domain-containing protein